MAKKPTIDIVIPSYNAQWLLEKNLPLVIKTSSEADKIIIVDDGGDDNTTDFLAKKFPGVVCVRHEENSGFSNSVNEGVRNSKSEFIILINNDVSPCADYIENSLKYFDDPKVFAVNFNEKSSSWPQVSWHSGKFQFVKGLDKSGPHYSAWPSGGSCIFRRAIWDRLGGLNEIYSPAYWEDIDLGWRAWKSGYKILWVPEAKVVHDHESTFGLKNRKTMDFLKQRNELLFIWINFSDYQMICSHILFLLTNCLKHPRYFGVVIAAIKDFIQKAKKERFPLSDKQVFSRVNTPYEN